MRSLSGDILRSLLGHFAELFIIDWDLHNLLELLQLREGVIQRDGSIFLWGHPPLRHPWLYGANFAVWSYQEPLLAIRRLNFFVPSTLYHSIVRMTSGSLGLRIRGHFTRQNLRLAGLHLFCVSILRHTATYINKRWRYTSSHLPFFTKLKGLASFQQNQ